MKNEKELNALKQELKEQELEAVNGGLSAEGRAQLSDKIEELYEAGKMTQSEFLEIYQIVWSGSDVMIELCLYDKIKEPGDVWEELYLFYRHLN